MKTVTIQIGNSDDKLTQKEWAAFVNQVDMDVKDYTTQIHFFGCSRGDSQWQNACWVAEVHDGLFVMLLSELETQRKKFKQASAAVTVGETTFV